VFDFLLSHIDLTFNVNFSCFLNTAAVGCTRVHGNGRTVKACSHCSLTVDRVVDVEFLTRLLMELLMLFTGLILFADYSIMSIVAARRRNVKQVVSNTLFLFMLVVRTSRCIDSRAG